MPPKRRASASPSLRGRRPFFAPASTPSTSAQAGPDLMDLAPLVRPDGNLLQASRSERIARRQAQEADRQRSVDAADRTRAAAVSTRRARNTQAHQRARDLSPAAVSTRRARDAEQHRTARADLRPFQPFKPIVKDPPALASHHDEGLVGGKDRPHLLDDVHHPSRMHQCQRDFHHHVTANAIRRTPKPSTSGARNSRRPASKATPTPRPPKRTRTPESAISVCNVITSTTALPFFRGHGSVIPVSCLWHLGSGVATERCSRAMYLHIAA